MAGDNKGVRPPDKGGRKAKNREDDIAVRAFQDERFGDDDGDDSPSDGDKSDEGRIIRKETPLIGPPAMLGTPKPAPGPRHGPFPVLRDTTKRSFSDPPENDVDMNDDSSDSARRVVPVAEVSLEEDEVEKAMTPPPISRGVNPPAPAPLMVPKPGGAPQNTRDPVVRTKTAEDSPPPTVTERKRSPTARGATMSEDQKDTSPPAPANESYWQKVKQSWTSYENSAGKVRFNLPKIMAALGAVILILVCSGLLYNYGGSLTDYRGGFTNLADRMKSAMGYGWQEKEQAAASVKDMEKSSPSAKPTEEKGGEKGVLVLASLDQQFDTRSRGKCVYFDLESKLTMAESETIRVCDPTLTVTEKKEVQVAGKPVHMEDILSGLKAQEGKIKDFKLAVGAEVACTGLAYMNGEAPCTMKNNPDRPKPPPVKAETSKPKPVENPPASEGKAVPDAPPPPSSTPDKKESKADSTNGTPPVAATTTIEDKGNTPPAAAKITNATEGTVNDILPTSAEGEKKE